MAYTTAEGRKQLLDTLITASVELDGALQFLGEAYELLDEHLAEQLEDNLFRPVQRAYGQAQHACAELSGDATQPGIEHHRGAPSHGVKGFVEEAVGAVSRAETAIAELQDSMLPVEVGDPQLRARLVAIREALAGVPTGARELLRVLGR